MRLDFTGQTALVTGASKNIGQAIATTLAEAGADVGVTARTDEDGLRETARRIEAAGTDAALATGDLANPNDIARVVEHVRDELGPITVLVNNATVRPHGPFLDATPADIDAAQNVNFRGIYLTTQHTVPDMLDADTGAIVNFLGALVYLGAPGNTLGFGTKLALEGLVRQLASELGPDGIRVNGVSPGLIDTDRDTPPDWDDTVDRITTATPLKRMGAIQEVADTCCYLASDHASFITGQVVHVNGGIYPTPNLTG